MDKELDKQLCERYTEIFKDRHGDMRSTAMCWGFDVGDGWFAILVNACWLIQQHINSSRKERASALQYNRALTRAIERNDRKGLAWYYTYGDDKTGWAAKQAQKDAENPKLRHVPEAIPQLVATQIKEKFGDLRFYFRGGDDYCDGVVRMAEAMSAVTCEECGKPGKIEGQGWVSCRCDDCRGEKDE